MSFLNKIEGPSDLKKLTPQELPQLCEEIRQQIIAVIANIGGHLASNLGVVELTVALHYLLNTPEDLIVWDTSNQAYTHKLLTGRREQFHTIRQFGGMSGFCKREESSYDTFNAGHAGTGVSAAVGFMEAREQKKQSHKIVCVVGDGALTSGLTLEGLQQAGDLSKDLLVILNDNQMSISKNVGAISAYLNRTITGEFYSKLKQMKVPDSKHFHDAISQMPKARFTQKCLPACTKQLLHELLEGGKKVAESGEDDFESN